jgi:Zn-dependent protease with chaperone function
VSSAGSPGRGSAALLYLLAGGFYVSLWGLAAGLSAVTVWYLWDGDRTLFGIPGLAVAAWCGFTALFLVAAQFVGQQERSKGRPLEPEEAPGLVDLMNAVRERLGVPPVRAIRIKPAPVIGVTHLRRRGRYLWRERKALVVGLPLLRRLSVDELRAAIAHELAHFAGGDVRRGAIVNAAWRKIAVMRAAIERGGRLVSLANPIWWYLRAYGGLLARGAAAVRRAQEKRADKLAAGLVGDETYGRALTKAAALGVIFRRASPGVLVRAGEQGRVVDNFFSELDDAVGALKLADRKRIVRDVVRQESSATDEHPPLRDRLTGLGVPLPPRGSEDLEGSAAELVPSLESIERELTPLVLRGLMLGIGARVRKRKKLREQAALIAEIEAEDGGAES